MKFCVLAFYGRIVKQLRQYERFIKPLWVVLAATFAAAMLSTFLECRPFERRVHLSGASAGRRANGDVGTVSTASPAVAAITDTQETPRASLSFARQ